MYGTDTHYQVSAARKLGLAEGRLTDSILIEACLENKSFAWDALIERYQALIYTCAIRSGLSQTDAADVFQHVCIGLYENLERVRDRTKLASWLIVTANREAWRIGKKRSGVASLDDPSISEGEQTAGDVAEFDPESIVLRDERSYLIHLGLNHLGEKCRGLLRMLYADEAPRYRDVAERLRIPVGSIGPTRARCLISLKEVLANLGFD